MFENMAAVGKVSKMFTAMAPAARRATAVLCDLAVGAPQLGPAHPGGEAQFRLLEERHGVPQDLLAAMHQVLPPTLDGLAREEAQRRVLERLEDNAREMRRLKEERGSWSDALRERVAQLAGAGDVQQLAGEIAMRYALYLVRRADPTTLNLIGATFASA
jgi:hypothetical protein